MHTTFVNQKSEVAKGLAIASLRYSDLGQRKKLQVIASKVEVTRHTEESFMVHFCDSSDWCVDGLPTDQMGDVQEAIVLLECTAPTVTGLYDIEAEVRKGYGPRDIILSIYRFELQEELKSSTEAPVLEDTAEGAHSECVTTLGDLAESPFVQPAIRIP